MTVNEMIEKLEKIAKDGKGKYPIVCCWTEADEDGEEYTITEDALIYDPCSKDEIWVTY